jgi:S-adenosylmethionine synthetase
MSISVFTSESVTEGHPDKVCDLVADSILDAHLAVDPRSRVACEVLAKGGNLVIAGEVGPEIDVDVEAVAREAITRIGYIDPDEPFNARGVKIQNLLSSQPIEISRAVSAAGDDPRQIGAGDQGLMFGFACDDTPELMPLPILLAHRLSSSLARARHGRDVDWLRPDGKTQVSVEYDGLRPVEVQTVLISTQHAPGVSQEEIAAFLRQSVVPQALGRWWHDGVELIVNPSGGFIEGGPSADAGVTGRKIIVDTYGGMARHGGGAFSGKDPTKVDRSGAYFCRWVARQIVARGIARRAEVQVAYAIGRAKPVSVLVEVFGTGDAEAAAACVRGFDFRPGAIIERLGLAAPIYAATTNYGHFGRPELAWEREGDS